jgi:hypothetical protein
MKLSLGSAKQLAYRQTLMLDALYNLKSTSMQDTETSVWIYFIDLDAAKVQHPNDSPFLLSYMKLPLNRETVARRISKSIDASAPGQ